MKYFFPLVPMWCGSTLMHEIINSSSNSSCVRNIGRYEGIKINGIKEIRYKYNNHLNKDAWIEIRELWEDKWSSQIGPIKFDVSPENIYHARVMDKVFKPNQFICIIRNPYAYVHSYIKNKRHVTPRMGVETDYIKFVCNEILEVMRNQMSNIETIDNIKWMTYGEWTDNPLKFKELVGRMIPELNDISIEGPFSHGRISPKSIVNKNPSKINALSRSDIDAINEVLEENMDVMKYFGYEIL